MNHEALRENLSAFVDGQLSEDDNNELRIHMADCPPCCEELAGLRRASEMFKARAKTAAPAGLADAVLDRADPARRRTPVLKFALALFTLTVGLTVAGKLFGPHLSEIFNQIMGMISGAASSVGSG